MYKVDYVDWKGREVYVYLCADNLEQATEIARVMQGVSEIKRIKEMKC